jgi:hypothetical protein
MVVERGVKERAGVDRGQAVASRNAAQTLCQITRSSARWAAAARIAACRAASAP